jgi:hypothetical protein
VPGAKGVNRGESIGPRQSEPQVDTLIRKGSQNRDLVSFGSVATAPSAQV